MDFEDQLNSFVRKLGLSEGEIEELKKSSIYQKTGPINQYKDHHQGTQPVRIVHSMFPFMFANTYPSFKEKLQEMIDHGKLNPQIDMTYSEESIKNGNIMYSPRVSAETRKSACMKPFYRIYGAFLCNLYLLY